MAQIGKANLLLLACLVLSSQAFAPVPLLQRSTCFARPGAVQPLMAKKKRRKRKDDAVPTPSADGAPLPIVSDELPDFELDPVLGDDDKPVVSSSVQSSSSSVTSSLSGDSISTAQMGSAKPMASLNDLLNDRSLESALPFDEPVDAEPLPSFAEYKSGMSPAAPAGSKKARQQARREAAIAAEEAEEEGGFFSNLPFIGGGKDDEKGGEKKKLNPIQLLENGTWAGIFALVAWEIYINSPLFDRAAPMAPVVYDGLPY